MFKKKDNKINCDMIDEFNKANNDIKNNKEYENIDKTYKYIKDYYLEKLKDNNFNIKIERLRIEDNLGIHPNSAKSFYTSYFIAVVGTFLYFIFQSIINAMNFTFLGINLNSIINVIILEAFLFIFVFSIAKDIKKENPKNFMLNILLRVLDDIEKELEQEQGKFQKEADQKEKWERIEKMVNSKKVTSLNLLPAFQEMASTAIKTSEFLGSIFRKNKK